MAIGPGLLSHVDAILKMGDGGVYPRIVDIQDELLIFQFGNDITDPSVAHVEAVFFEGQANDKGARAFYLYLSFW